MKTCPFKIKKVVDWLYIPGWTENPKNEPIYSKKKTQCDMRMGADCVGEDKCPIMIAKTKVEDAHQKMIERFG